MNWLSWHFCNGWRQGWVNLKIENEQWGVRNDGFRNVCDARPVLTETSTRTSWAKRQRGIIFDLWSFLDYGNNNEYFIHNLIISGIVWNV